MFGSSLTQNYRRHVIGALTIAALAAPSSLYAKDMVQPKAPVALVHIVGGEQDTHALDTDLAIGKGSATLFETAAGPSDLSHPAAKQIGTLGHRAMEAIADQNMSTAARENFFSELIEDNLDIRQIAKFVVGKYWRRASDADREAYLEAFTNYLVKQLSRQLGSAQIDQFEVTGAQPGKRNSVLIKSEMIRGEKPASIVWKLRQKEDRYLVVDLAIEGVSMAVTRRQEFASIIRANGGKISSLTKILQQKS